MNNEWIFEGAFLAMGLSPWQANAAWRSIQGTPEPKSKEQMADLLILGYNRMKDVKGITKISLEAHD